MATLATQLNRAEGLTRPVEHTRAPRVAQTNPYRLRALPNEDICLFTKQINNARLVREADPSGGNRCWSAIGAATLAAVLLMGVAAPRTAWVVAGYHLQSLRQESQRLLDERTTCKWKKPRCWLRRAWSNWPERTSWPARRRARSFIWTRRLTGRWRLICRSRTALEMSLWMPQPMYNPFGG